MMKWEAEQKGYTCNDCYLSMQNCHDKSICCEDETGLCDFFEELADLKENKMDNGLISRQQAIDALHMHLMYRMGTDSNKKRLDDWINNLPSAQPEQKKGEWLRYGEDGYPNNEDTVFWQCDQCLEQYTGRTKRIPNYCPNCGAYMKGGAI